MLGLEIDDRRRIADHPPVRRGAVDGVLERGDVGRHAHPASDIVRQRFLATTDFQRHHRGGIVADRRGIDARQRPEIRRSEILQQATHRVCRYTECVVAGCQGELTTPIKSLPVAADLNDIGWTCPVAPGAHQPDVDRVQSSIRDRDMPGRRRNPVNVVHHRVGQRPADLRRARPRKFWTGRHAARREHDHDRGRCEYRAQFHPNASRRERPPVSRPTRRIDPRRCIEHAANANFPRAKFPDWRGA